MSHYRHTQKGTLTLWSLGAGALIAAIAIGLVSRTDPRIALIPGAVLLVLAACMVVFGTLTVEVTSDSVRLWFGAGLIRKTWRLKEILGAEPVRNHWLHGWGIHLTPHGWLFNVSGLDAVELRFEGDRKVRIGTDEPRELAAAIRRAAGLPEDHRR